MILNHVSRSIIITWFLFNLKAWNLIKWLISTWSFVWWCQFIDWLRFETRPSSLSNLGMAYKNITLEIPKFKVCKACDKIVDLTREQSWSIIFLRKGKETGSQIIYDELPVCVLRFVYAIQFSVLRDSLRKKSEMKKIFSFSECISLVDLSSNFAWCHLTHWPRLEF